MNDKQGRPYAKLSELKAGDSIELDNGFTCAKSGVTTVQEDNLGLYFTCSDGRHTLAGQVEDETLIGIYRA